MTQKRSSASLPASRSATTLRLRWLMTEQEKIEISERLRELKHNSAETNESIADAVGVKERSVAGWLSPTKPQAISYDNAKKVAALFNVSIDWLWRGKEDITVPADFIDRFVALEKEVKQLRRDAKPSAAQAAKQAAEKVKARRSASRPKQQRRRKSSP